MKKLLSALILLFVMVNAYAQMNMTHQAMTNFANQQRNWVAQQSRDLASGRFSCLSQKNSSNIYLKNISKLETDSAFLAKKKSKLEQDPQKNEAKI